jgi:hypothetical protein
MYQLKTEILCFSRWYPSLDPPKSPLRRGTLSRFSSRVFNRDFENTLVPPFLRGARGDLRGKKHTLKTDRT